MEKDLFDKSYSLVKESMKNVIQEVLLTLPDGSSHMVYITEMNVIGDNQVEVFFNTPSEDRKEELYPHVIECIKTQYHEAKSSKKLLGW